MELTDRAYRTLNPATGELIQGFDTLSDEEAEQILASGHSAYGAWCATAVSHRASLVTRLAELLEAESAELARLVTLEMGKPFGQSLGEIELAAATLRYYARHGEELLADEELHVAGFTKVVTRREPLGVVLAIEPWNAPIYQAIRASAPNLVLGNVVVLKPAEISAGSSLLLESLFTRAGFPTGTFRTALMSIEQVSAFIADPRVRAVTLTGSERAGAAVGQQAGHQIKPVILELGGSDAFIVLESADVAQAAGTAAACRLTIGGQTCISPKRLIVVESVADEFVERFVSTFASQAVGDPFDPATTVGPLSSTAALELLHEQYQDAIEKGATVLLPGGPIDGPGAFFSPAVLTNITPSMRIYYEEVFGPIAVIHRVPDAEAAVRLANDSRYGLGGTVFGEDLDEARRVAGLLDTGGVGINKHRGAPPEVAFGGTKHSGVGRELGRAGMDCFANVKTYSIA